jgi:Do/DeqQ family serine protease
MTRRLIVVLLTLATGFLAGLVLTGRMRSADEAGASQPPAGAAEQARPAAAAVPQGLPDLTAIAERAVNAVTSISSTQIVRNASPFADDPFFRRFFGDDMFGPQRAQSLGSGVIVSPDGYVLTNAHVVGVGREVPEVSVILSDKRELRAKIIGVDEMTDLAVLKISAGARLPTIPWGDSSKLRVAEWVLAIGNPFGVFNQSVTLGIVSATGRTVEGLGMESFIQTDAAINKGNSGGALINARGELVGINSAIYSETGGYQGIGLAVPSNLARKTLDELVKTGTIRRGTISGIELATLTSEYAERLGAPDTNGVLVTRIDPRAPAAVAGLRPGDIIVAFNGTRLDGAAHFMRVMSDAQIGSTATLAIIREGRQATVRVVIDQAQTRVRRR